MSVPAVARIAYLTAETLIDFQPELPAVSHFSNTYGSLLKSSPRQPKVLHIPSGADPVDIILRNANASSLSFTTSSNSNVLTRLLLRFAEISDFPVVLHIAVQD